MRYPIYLRLISALLWISLSSPFAKAAEDEDKYSSYFENVSQEYSRDRILEFWGYQESYGDDNYSNTGRLRYYQPIDHGRFRGTLRLDTSVVSAYGSSYPSQHPGQYNQGSTMLTVWGNHPGFFSNWGSNLGARVIFPFGNGGQWAIGPQVGASLRPTGKTLLNLADFSPLARFMYGFYPKNNPAYQAPLIRNLELYPTLGFQLTPNTQLRMWDENGVVYNATTGGWFVPIDGMITHRVNRSFLFALGASKQIVQTYLQYDWTVYGKVSFNF